MTDPGDRLIDAVRAGVLAERWRGLTPWEQAVGLALSDGVIHGSSTADCPVSPDVLRLAPRVAAAINEAYLACARQERLAVPDGIYWNAQAVQAAALAALRGTPPT